MKLLLLLPILLYLVVILWNIWLLNEIKDVNILWLQTYSVPVFLFSSIFIVLYAILVFFVYDWLNSFLHYKIDNLDKQIVELKSKLYDWQEKLLSKITKETENYVLKLKESDEKKLFDFNAKNEKLLEELRKENKEQFLSYKKETDKILEKVSFIDPSMWDKIKNLKDKI